MGIDYFNLYELNSLQILLTVHKKTFISNNDKLIKNIKITFNKIRNFLENYIFQNNFN